MTGRLLSGRLGGLRDVIGAAGARDHFGQLVERLHLVGDDAAHRGGLFAGFARQIHRAAAQFLTGRLQLALDFAGHAAQFLRDALVALGGLLEQFVHLRQRLLIGRGQFGGRALALAGRLLTQVLVLAGQHARRGGGGVVQERRDLARPRLGLGQRARNHSGEPVETRFVIGLLALGLVVQGLQAMQARFQRGVDGFLRLGHFVETLFQRFVDLALAAGHVLDASVEGPADLGLDIRHVAQGRLQILRLRLDGTGGFADAVPGLPRHTVEAVDLSMEGFDCPAERFDPRRQRSVDALELGFGVVDRRQQGAMGVGHGRDQVADILLHPAAGFVERSAHFGLAAAQRFDQIIRASGKGADGAFAEGHDLRNDFAAARGEEVHQLQAARVEPFVQFGRAGAQFVGEGAATAIDRLLDLADATVEFRADLAETGDDIALEQVDMAAEARRDFAGADAERFIEAFGIGGELFRDRGGAGQQHLRRSRGPCRRSVRRPRRGGRRRCARTGRHGRRDGR